MSDYFDVTTVIFNLRVASAIVSSLGTGINILLIWDMGVYNGHINLILVMSIYQLLNDTTTALIAYPTNTLVYLVSICFSCYGGLSAPLVSNFMLARLFLLIKRRSQLNEWWVLTFVNFFCAVPCFTGLGFILTKRAAFGVSLFNIIRLVSICVNVISLTAFAVWGYRQRRRHLQTSKASVIAQFEAKAIAELTRRLIYYPVVQVVSRIAPTIYILKYGNNFNPSKISLDVFILEVFFVVLVPVGAVGFLIVFLAIQPRAWRHLVTRLTTGKRYVPPEQPQLFAWKTGTTRSISEYGSDEIEAADEKSGDRENTNMEKAERNEREEAEIVRRAVTRADENDLILIVASRSIASMSFHQSNAADKDRNQSIFDVHMSFADSFGDDFGINMTNISNIKPSSPSHPTIKAIVNPLNSDLPAEKPTQVGDGLQDYQRHSTIAQYSGKHVEL